MRAQLRLDGMREAIERLDDVGERARRPEPVLRSSEVQLELQKSERRRFSHARGFKRISPEWAAEKRRRGLDPRVMRATGRLASALINAVRSDGVRLDVFNRELRWGIRGGRTNIYYAAVQAKAGRRVVVIDKPARREITSHVETFIARGFPR